MAAGADGVKHFDLNIEKILESWEVRHAVRELIANAIDEQVLSGTADVQVHRTADGAWHVRDFGRGLRYESLTQNENPEKLEHAGQVIGKFGVGLKDALATLDRRGVRARLRSRHCEITLRQASKHGFSDVVTLHAAVESPSEPGFVGTDVILEGASDADVAAAKDFFLRFSNESVLDVTPYGQVLRRDPARAARVYVSGILVAEEPNFAFSYNITSLTAAMRKALNRERTNVGRGAYSDRVKAMLLATRSEAVASVLADELGCMAQGTQHDEVQWADVAVHASQFLNASRKVIFMTAAEAIQARNAVDDAVNDGYQIVTIPEVIRERLTGLRDTAGEPVRDIAVFQREQASRFDFEFVDPSRLNEAEQAVWAWRDRFAEMAGGLPPCVKEIVISEQLRPDYLTGQATLGVWEAASGRIIIRRSELSTLREFAATLLHEMTHARTGYPDISRPFETALTELVGRVAEAAVERPDVPQQGGASPPALPPEASAPVQPMELAPEADRRPTLGSKSLWRRLLDR